MNVLDAGLCPYRRLNTFSHVVGVRKWDIRIQLQVQRHADAAVVAVDGDVVHVANERFGERGGQGAVAQAEALASRLEVHDNLAVWQRPAHCRFDLLADLLPLNGRLSRRDRDDGIGEILAARLANAQPAKVDVIAQVGNRGVCAGVRFGWGGVHQHARVLEDQASRRGEDDRGDEQRGDRIALVKAGADRDQPGEHRHGAGHIAGEVKRVRSQRRRLVPGRTPQGNQHTADINSEGDRDHREHVPVRFERLAATGQPADRRHDHDDAAPVRIAASPSAARFSARRWP